jgi:PAS domain S-box-containing protein
LTTTIRLEAIRRIKLRLAVSAVASLAVMAFICSGAFPYYYPVALTLLIITLACDIEGTLVGLLITVTALTLATLSGYGPTRNVLPFPKQLLFDQIFLLALIFTILPISVAISERRRLHGDLLFALKRERAEFDRAQAELVARREAEQHLNIALKVGAVGIWRSDQQMKEFWADDYAAAVFGLPRSDNGTIEFAAWKKAIHPDDLPIVMNGLNRAKNNEPSLRPKYRMMRPNGEVRHVETSRATVTDKDGRFVCHVGTVVDITDRKRAEEEREKNELERQVLLQQLMQAQKKEAMGALAAGVAHDFNNLLGAIKGYSELLQDDLAHEPQSLDFVERISAACDRGKEIVAQILTFARSRVPEQQVVDLSGFLRESEALVSKAIAEGSTLTFSYEVQDVHVKANSGQLLELVTNLCVNASQSFDGGRGKISIQLGLASESDVLGMAEARYQKNCRLIGQVDNSRSYVRLRITDKGAGIAPDVLPKIFDPFFTTKERQRGSGLGLSVCQGIVESHGGFCLVESEQGKGTSFSVFLPVTNEPLPDAPEKSKAVQPARGTERILLVDDESDITDVMTRALRRIGYQVSAFNDPVVALKAFQNSPSAWDLVILDLTMPRMQGTELANELKAINPDLPIILCSGYGGSNDASPPPAVDWCLAKPVEMSGLTRDIRALLDGSAAMKPKN